MEAGASSLATSFLVLFFLGSSAGSAFAAFLRLPLAAPFTAVKALAGEEAGSGGEEAGTVPFFALAFFAERGVLAGGGVGSLGGSLSESLSESESEDASDSAPATASMGSASAVSGASSSSSASAGRTPPVEALYAASSSLYFSVSFSYLFL